MIPPKRKNRSAKVKTKKTVVPYKYFVEIVADGALANGSTAGGLQVPVAILDASNRSDLSDVIAAHSHDHLNNGDIETVWTGAPDNSWIGLDIKFKRPIVTALIEIPH